MELLGHQAEARPRDEHGAEDDQPARVNRVDTVSECMTQPGPRSKGLSVRCSQQTASDGKRQPINCVRPEKNFGASY